MAKDDNYIGMLLEDIQSKLQGVAEGVSDLNKKADRTDKRLDKIEENTNIIPAQQAAIKGQTAQLNDHEQRITALESA
jgi:peptidoglycan hydrolase CwlO-like protein